MATSSAGDFMFPLKFYCKINKKPKGNWRPKVDLQLQIKASDFPWRPKIGSLSIFGERHGYSFRPIEEGIAFGKFFAFNESAEPWEGIWIDSAIHLTNRKGCKEYYSTHAERHNGTMYRYSYTYLLEKNYIDHDIDLSKEFFLCWRENPDYTDIAKQLSSILSILQEMLKDGLNSKESQEILITEKQVIKEKEKSIKIKRKVRL